MTRHDISYVVQQLSQFMSDPRTPHMNAAIHVIRYLKGTIRYNVNVVYNFAVASLFPCKTCVLLAILLHKQQRFNPMNIVDSGI